MPLHHAILSLLSDGPGYGYELRSSLAETIGPQWGEINVGQLYQVLDRLRRDGLIEGETVRSQTRWPDRQVYELTDAGRRELQQWLEAPTRRQAGFRDDFFLKLMAGARAGADTFARVLEDERRELLGRLRGLDELREQRAGEPLVGLLIEAASAQTGAQLELVDVAEQRSAELVAHAAAARSARAAPSTGTASAVGQSA